jgi:hypothetical protein
MLYREIIAVCSQIQTKHRNTLFGQNVQLLKVKLVVHILATVNVNVVCVIFHNTEHVFPHILLHFLIDKIEPILYI